MLRFPLQSRIEANSTTAAQQLITETLRGAQLPSITLMTNGEIARKKCSVYKNLIMGACK